MNWLMELPTKLQANKINLLLGGKNTEKHIETCSKNRKKRKSKK